MSVSGECRDHQAFSVAARIVRATGSSLLRGTGALYVWSRLCRHGDLPGVLILNLHAVSDSTTPGGRYFRSGMNLETDHFRALLAFLQKRYRLVPLAEADRYLEAPTPTERSLAVLTFDDGYRSVAEVAAPLLREAGIPAAVFLNTDHVGSKRCLWWDRIDIVARHPTDATKEAFAGLLSLPRPTLALLPPNHVANRAVDCIKHLDGVRRSEWLRRLFETVEIDGLEEREAPRMLDWDQVRGLHREGFEIGNHTATHGYLDEMTREEAQAEIRLAHSTIEREIGEPPRYFAFPDGRVAYDLGDLLLRMSYRRAFSTVQRMNWPCRDANSQILGRIGVSKDFSGVGGGVSDSLMWAELLGVWDLILLRRWRTRRHISRNGA